MVEYESNLKSELTLKIELKNNMNMLVEFI